MGSNRLQPNPDKTDVMWSASARRSSSLPVAPVIVAGITVDPVFTVRNLGFLIDADLGSALHVRLVIARCFAALRHLRQLRQYVTDDCFRSLVAALVHTRFEYGNFILVGRRLQSILNAAVRLMFRLRRYDHVTGGTALAPRPAESVVFRLAVTTYRVLCGAAPSYLDVQQSHSRLQSSASGRLEVPAHRLASVGRRSFRVAAPTIWNSLPDDVQFAPSLPVLPSRLKTHLFRQSFPDIIL
jgi:hypothetical protein